MFEKVLNNCYEDKTVSLKSINKKDFCVGVHKMIARYLAHLKHVVGKSIENETIEDMPNNNLRHIHEMNQSLTRDKIIHIMEECSVLKTSTSTTINTNRATESNVSDCKSLIRNKPTSPSSKTKLDHENKKGNDQLLATSLGLNSVITSLPCAEGCVRICFAS